MLNLLAVKWLFHSLITCILACTLFLPYSFTLTSSIVSRFCYLPFLLLPTPAASCSCCLSLLLSLPSTSTPTYAPTLWLTLTAVNLPCQMLPCLMILLPNTHHAQLSSCLFLLLPNAPSQYKIIPVPNSPSTIYCQRLTLLIPYAPTT